MTFRMPLARAISSADGPFDEEGAGDVDEALAAAGALLAGAADAALAEAAADAAARVAGAGDAGDACA
ncbi:hypothetical protein ACI3KS_10105, partial [Microbacterium sp. ZW T5_45]|uniref:hypothetical protein n=1 Tax=Microbacterium sp. ZW T5_45 TaxID=3378080 RepID=UPI0038546B35